MHTKIRLLYKDELEHWHHLLIKLKIELEIALLFNLKHFNGTGLTTISLRCANFGLLQEQSQTEIELYNELKSSD